MHFLIYRELDYLPAPIQIKEFDTLQELADYHEMYGRGYEIVKVIEGEEVDRVSVEFGSIAFKESRDKHKSK